MIASTDRDRGMEAASAALYSLQSKTSEALLQSKLTRHLVVQQMRTYLSRLTLNITALPVVHVAGTKGKGSTCAMTEAIVRAHGLSTGLFTSPHLVNITERFRVNGRSVSDDLYLEHFWAVWDKLSAASVSDEDDSELPRLPSFFRFLTLVAFHMFASLSLDCVILEVGMGGRLDSTNIIDRPVVCGIASIGFDHMEVLGDTISLIAREKAGIIKPHSPTFTVPQSQEVLTVLGDCADEEGSAPVVVVGPLPSIVTNLGLEGDHQRENAALAVKLAHTFLDHYHATHPSNDTVSRSLAQWNDDRVSERALEGLAQVRWDGRCEIVCDAYQSNLYYFIDGAHTDASMAVACHWFQQQCQLTPHHYQSKGIKSTKNTIIGSDSDTELTLTGNVRDNVNVLLFNSGHVRNPFDLLTPLVDIGTQPHSQSQFTHLVTCPFDHDRPHFNTAPSFDALLDKQLPQSLKSFARDHGQSLIPPRGSSWQHTLVRVWELLLAARVMQSPALTQSASRSLSQSVQTVYPHQTHVFSHSSQALSSIARLASAHPRVTFRVFICGSLYLVGNVLDKLGVRVG